MRTPTEPWKLRPLRVSSSTHKDRDSFYTRHVVQCYMIELSTYSLLYCSTRVCLLHYFVLRPAAAAFQTEYVGGLFTPILFQNVIIATITGVWIEKFPWQGYTIVFHSAQIPETIVMLLFTNSTEFLVMVQFMDLPSIWLYSLWSDKEK